MAKSVMATTKRGRDHRQNCFGFLLNAFSYCLLLFHIHGLLLGLIFLTLPTKSVKGASLRNSTEPPSLSTTLAPVPSLINPNTRLVSDTPESCEWDIDERWPKKPNKTLVLGFLMTKRGDVREKLGLKIPGMISYAVNTINDEGILPQNYSLQIEIRDTLGDEIVSTRHVTDMVCRNISAFIGPEHTCAVEATIAEARNLPMISYACTDSEASKRKTFARTNPSEDHILRATLEIIIHFKWQKFSIIYDEIEYKTMAETLHDLAKKRNLKVNHFVEFTSKEEFPNIFSRTKDETRIYVLIGHKSYVPKALVDMTFSGLLKQKKKEYFLLYVDIKEELKQENWIHFIFEATMVDQLNMSNDCLPEDLKSYEDGFMVVSNTLPTDITRIEERTREYNQKEPFCLKASVKKLLNRKSQRKEKGSQRLVNTLQHVPLLSASYLYDAVMLYAKAVREIYDDAIKNNVENVDVEEIGRNGTAVAQRLQDRTYESILGFNVTMGPDRASEGSYSIYYFQSSEECKKKIYNAKLNCSTHCLVKLSDFRNNTLNTTVAIEILDEPHCGYKNDKCPLESSNPRLIAMGILVASVVVFFLFSISKYRHWKYEQEIFGLMWRINKEELRFKQSDYLSQSRMSIMSGVSQDCNYDSYISLDRRATFRGTECCIKTLCLESRKQELGRETKKTMRSMREIKHRNVCPFIGAYVEDRKLTLITEYAMRGSLEDILENPDVKLDDVFITSLVQDLLRAMCFLHQSFGPHGNLKSTNCVVTGRWVLQVTDYSLHEVRCEEYRALERAIDDVNSEEERAKYLKSCLWKAPELLRQDKYAPGTKEGDVYAFGIILHEIMARKGPFSTSDWDGYPNYETIIEDVKRGRDISGHRRRPNCMDFAISEYGSRSDSSYQELVMAMKESWEEDPKDRPTFKGLTQRMKKLRKTGDVMDNLVKILEEHNKNLEGLVKARTQDVYEEKKKTEELLHNIFPSPVANNLCKNIPVEAQSYDSVTLYFSDIVGFTTLASSSSPYEIVRFLDDLYSNFDRTIEGYDVYKVETIGDAYVVVSGLPKTNNGRHAGEIASMSLELLQHTKTFKIEHKPQEKLKIRIGLHTGPVIAGVVGRIRPRYCLFGDSVNTASRMESNGEPLRIHISSQCRDALVALGGYIIEKRGYIEVKGKGSTLTYWLNAATDKAITRVEKPAPTMSFFQRIKDEGSKELRRRSPRLSVDLRTGERRTPSLSSRTRDADFKPSVCDSPVRDLAHHHRQRLNHHHRTISLESHTRGGLLSPPMDTISIGDARTPSAGSVRESHSLDNIPAQTPLANPALKGSRFNSSPSSSEPTLGPDDTPRVNFCSNSRFKDELETEMTELNPMLDESIEGDCSDLENDRPESPSFGKKESVMRHILQAIIPKGRRERLNSEKSSINGLQRENRV